MTLLAALLILLLWPVSRTGATAIVVPLLPSPVDLPTSPAMRIITHGAQSPLTYRITVEIENPLRKTPLRISPPPESLRRYISTDTGTEIFNKEPEDAGNVFITYDAQEEERFPLRRIRVAYSRIPGEAVVDSRALPEYGSSIALSPGKITAVDLDFDIPFGREIPQRITLAGEKLELGEGIVVDFRTDLAFQGRGVLRYLNRAYEPWTRAQGGPIEAQAKP